ncbi:tape measure protein [Xenorhabdus sp. DI]|uniref:phage tail tape measure protein n=1 Tax=Xenorhabdus doucetiae TaxID=351671 RepID=UPI001995B750|nr:MULTISPECIES: phage tail tape measure protein [unclassified Xenorhabdus]MBD2786416.1 tape measure protein [Xenorhabdus sp. 3]MBD2790201.1 tape measure protein [Xenorhabdus sp. DI]
MAKLRELIIKISADSKSFQSEIARASRMGADYYRVMEKGGRQAAAASRSSQQALRELNNQLVSAKETAKGMMGAMAGMFATGRLISLADNYNSLNARIKLATTSTEDFKHAQQELMRISQYTGSTFESNAGLFSRVASSLREYGYSTKDILSLTDALATGLQVSGASAEETSSLIVQLSQALGRGVLRGQDFNSVAQSGQRIMKALSDGLGVAQKDLKELADAGELTTPKIVPALIGQLSTLHKEFDSMPNSVSAASTRVTNAFQEWVGEANKTTAVTATLSGALDGVARNIDTVAAVATGLVAIGAARFFGSMTSGAITATGRIFATQRAEVALASAQVKGAQASILRAKAEVSRAYQAIAAAKNADQQTQAEKRLSQAQARLTRNIDARKAAQDRLNGVTSVGRRMLGGALGLIGGIPGLLMLGAGAWYTMYQNQEQARLSAQEYARTINEIPQKIPKMNLPETADNEKEAKEALNEQNRLISEQINLIDGLKERVKKLNQARDNPKDPLSDDNLLTLAKGLEKATAELAVEQSRLNTLQERAKEIKEVLAQLEQRRNSLIHQEKEKQDAMRHSLAMMNGEYSEFNRLMSVGNRLLQERQYHAQIPFPLPQAPLDDRQKDFLKKSERDLALSSLQGEDKVRKQAEFAAEDQGLNTPVHRDNYQQYLNNMVAAYRNGEKAKEAQAAASKAASKAAKTAREAAAAQENYRKKVADLNQEIQVEQVRMKDGERATSLFAASMEISATYTGKQREELIRLSQASILAKQRTQDLHDAIEADPYRKAAHVRKEAEAQLQRQIAAGDIQTTEEAARRKQAITLNYLNAVAEANQRYAVSPTAELVGNVDPLQDIQNQLEKRKALIQTYATETLITEQRKNELLVASDNEANQRRYEAAMQLYASQGRLQKMTVDLFTVTKERMTNMLTGMLTGTQTFKEGMVSLFASLTQSIIQNMVDMAAQALATNTVLKGAMGIGGSMIGGMTGGLGSAAAGTAANTNAMGMASNWQAYVPNAKGGVYTSANLSQYSGQIVSSPTLFAFAKGAGLMGEAGPEAIMPLTRGADGSLGVRAIMPPGGMGGGAPNIQVYITDSGGRSQVANGADAALGESLARGFAQVYYAERDKDLRPGGAIHRAIRGR